MFKKVLLSFRGVSHQYEGDLWDLQNFSWRLFFGDRVWVQCQRQDQYELLWRLFQQNLKPKHGTIEEWHAIPFSSDEMIVSRLKPGNMLLEALESKLFNKRIWYGGHHIFLATLMEHLQIPLAERRIPYQKLSDVMKYRFHLLALMVARVQLLLVRRTFQQMDSLAWEVFKKWQSDYSGTVVGFGDDIPESDVWNVFLKVQTDGQVRIVKKG